MNKNNIEQIWFLFMKTSYLCGDLIEIYEIVFFILFTWLHIILAVNIGEFNTKMSYASQMLAWFTIEFCSGIISFEDEYGFKIFEKLVGWRFC